jgi:cytoskeleton protein RodZ
VTAAGDAAPAGPGSRLRAERERQGLTLAKAAEQLRLDASTVETIEAGRFADLGATVYARGYLRKYAALLGLSPEELLADYERLIPQSAEPSLIPAASAREYSASRRPVLLAAAAIAMLVIVGGSLWWFTRQGGAGAPTAPAPREAETASAATPASPPAQAEAAPASGAADAGQAETVPAGDAVESSADVPPAEAVPAAAVPPAGAPHGLEVAFSSPCWIEVYDTAGRRLAFDLAPARSTRRLPGTGPWRIVLGNASAARLTAGGREVALPAELVVRNTAWVEVSSDGTVRRPPGPRLAPGGP